MSPDIIKVNYPKNYQTEVTVDNTYDEELAKLTAESFANASTTNTLKHIKTCLAKRLRDVYKIKDKAELTEKVNTMMKIHGLSDENFDPMKNFSDMISTKTNDTSIDDNGNKGDDNGKAIKGIIKEAELSFDKLIGYDYLYRTAKEIYGKAEAQRLMGLLYDYSLGMHDSTKILIPYSYYGHTSVLIRINYNDIRMVTMKKLWEMYEHHANGEFINTEDLKDQFVIDNVYLSKADKFKGTRNKCTIKELPYIKQHIEVWDLNNGWVDIKRIIKHKNEKDFILYQTNNGDFALVTEDHPIYMADGSEKLARDLVVEDEILKEKLNLPDVYKNIEINSDLAYISGFLLGDGNYNAASLDYSKKTFDKKKEGLFWRKGGNGISIYQNDVDNSLIKQKIDKCFNNINWFKFNDKQNRCISFSSYAYNYILANMFGYTYKENSYTKHLPENFNAWTDDSKYAFLAGLIDSDGSVVDNFVTIRMASYATINQLYDVLYKDESFKGLKKILDKQCEENKLVCGFVFKVLKDHPLIKLSEKLTKSFDKNPNKFEKYEEKHISTRQDNCIAKIYRFNRKDITETSFYYNELENVYDITTSTGRFYANGMVQHNCWALDTTKLVMEGRPFGVLPSKPAKSVDSFLDCLCDSIPELANHLAGAIALSTLFLDITHLLIYKQRIPLDKVKNDKVTRKYLENRFQKLIHSVCHPTRDSIESPFTNVSVFDKEKLHNFIGPDNYQWYFPKNIKVLADNELGGENGKISREEFDDFIVEYITEVQKIFIDFFDKGDPSQNGMQYRFPVTTPNMTKKIDEMTGKYYLDKDNEMLNYITKKDIARYNLFTSLGTKIASCCRMINNKEMMDSLGSTVNSFGGSGGASLGSHRAITINFVRIAYEATSYEDYLRILKERIDDCAKILKAHKVLLYKLTDMGLEPFVNRGWIILERLFSTFGVNGLYESNIILKEKFGDVVDDYKKDILINFNNFYKEAAKRENIVANAEQTPVESMSPKLFKADNILFGNPYDFPQMYANQFVPTWVHTTIREKFTEEGKYDGYMDGGSIAHLQIGSDLTPSQAKEIIMQSVEAGCEHFALNAVYSRCKECGAVEKANWKECPHCHSEKVEHLSRVVGFFVVMDNINPVRRENDWKKRTFITKEELNTQLGK